MDLDFIHVLKEKLESLSYTPKTVRIGLYDKNNDSIAVRPSPTNINERYMDKGKIYPFVFDVNVHYKSNLQGYNVVNGIFGELDNPTMGDLLSKNGSYSLITMTCLGTPSHIEETEYGTLWNASFEAELYIRGDE